MSDEEILRAFADACQGCTCRLTRREFDWRLDFGKANLQVAAPWRLIRDGRIAYGSDDHNQQFGLPAPVDGEVLANDIVRGRAISRVVFDEVTADIRIHFGDDVRLDVFNHSMGYEGWQAYVDGDPEWIIGRGGGVISIV